MGIDETEEVGRSQVSEGLGDQTCASHWAARGAGAAVWEVLRCLRQWRKHHVLGRDGQPAAEPMWLTKERGRSPDICPEVELSSTRQGEPLG